MASLPARESVSNYREVADAVRCLDCGAAACLIGHGGGHPYCVGCARKAVPFAPQALLRPLGGRAVILPDIPREKAERSLIIIPRAFRDNQGKLRNELTFTGLVVAVGPGWFARRGPKGQWIADAPGVGRRQEMPCEMWDRVVCYCKHEASIAMWRGLAIVPGVAIMAACQEEGAAQ